MTHFIQYPRVKNSLCILNHVFCSCNKASICLTTIFHYLDCGAGYTNIYISQNLQNCIFKMDTFYLCKHNSMKLIKNNNFISRNLPYENNLKYEQRLTLL